MSTYSSFLFPQTGAFDGVARLLDLGGTMVRYNSSRDEGGADTRALRADLAAVGEDFRKVACRLHGEVVEAR